MTAPRNAFPRALNKLYDYLDTQLGGDVSVLSATEIAFLDGAATANTGTNKVIVTGTSGALSLAGNVTLAALNFILDSTTGTKIGTAVSQKLGFWNATPVIQQASAAQAAVVTTAATNTSPYGFATAAQADAIVALVNRMRLDLVTVGIIKGSA